MPAEIPGLSIEAYSPSMSDECRELERRCPQGRGLRLGFERDEFHGRSESYDEWAILVARAEGRAIGTFAYALKDVSLHGAPERAAFFYDGRVLPELRGRGLARAMGRQAVESARNAGARLCYGYCVDDNEAARAVGGAIGGSPVGGYRYLVWPVRDRGPSRSGLGGPFREVSADRAHADFLAHSGPFDFYCDPFRGGRLQGHVASCRGSDAGASIWSNAGILEEKIEALPWPQRFAGLASRLPFSARLGVPRLPARGERIRSWIVFDFFARTGEDAIALMDQVNARALAAGIEWCYVIVADGPSPWLSELRAASGPSVFSPLVRYALVMGVPGQGGEPTPHIRRTYIDVRDV